MAYINFEEERFVAKEQLNVRKENNKKLFKEIRVTKNLPKYYANTKKFSYKNFENRNFGDKNSSKEEEFLEINNEDIVCSIFKNCEFKNIKFKNCKFIGCNFESCKFNGGGVIFDGCTFVKEDASRENCLNKKDNFSTTFFNCEIYAKFSNCTMSFSIFELCLLHDTSFEESDMTSIIIIDSELNRINIKDSNLTGIKILNTYIVDLEFKDIDKSKLDEKSFIDKIPIKHKTRDEYEGIYMVYETIADKFKENSLNNNFGEYYYLCKVTQHKVLKPIPKLSSYVYWISCGYGERPIFAIISSIIIILIFSVLYLFTGMDVDGEIIRYGSNLFNMTYGEILKDFNESLNLSVGMFAGVGFNNGNPTPSSYMVSNVEMLIGVIMMGVGVGTLTKKLIR